jgi:hypothetical protein
MCCRQVKSTETYAIWYITFSYLLTEAKYLSPNLICKTLWPSHSYNYSPNRFLTLFLTLQYSFRGTTSHARQINRVTTAVISRCTCTILWRSETFLMKTWPYSIGRIVGTPVSPLFRPTSRFKSTQRPFVSDLTSRLGRSDVRAI